MDESGFDNFVLWD